MVVNRIGQMECPFGDAVAYISAVIMDNTTVFGICKRIGVRYRIIDDRIRLYPNRVVRPERLS